MTDETMKDGERAAFEAWASEALESHYDEHDSLQTYDSESAWLGWQARATSPQSALSDEQIKQVWKRANGTHPDNGQFGQMVVDFARALLNQASTERMSDAACEGYRDYQDGMERENNPFLEPHSVGFQEWEKGWNAARKAEVERGEGQS